MGDGAVPAVGGDVPRRRVDAGDAGPRRRRRTPPRRRDRGRARRRRGVGRRHPRRHRQVDPGRRARACTSTCSSGSRSTRPRSRSSATPQPALRARHQHPRGRPVLAGAPSPAKRRAQAARTPRSAAAPGRTRPFRARPRVDGMAPLVHGFDPPERFVTGTVGMPGQRTFFLQARDGHAAGQRRAGEAAGRRPRRADRRAARRGDGQPASNEAVIPAVAPLGLDDDRAAGAADRGGVPGRHDDPVLGPRRRPGRDRGLPVHRGRGGRRPTRSTRTSRSPSPTSCSWSGSRPAPPGRS